MAGVKASPYVAPMANGLPGNVPSSDLNAIIDWSIPAQVDANGRTYQTTYGGQRFYVNDGSTPMPTNTFLHSYAWDPGTGTYQASLNQGGIVGGIEGAGAVLAGPIAGALLGSGGAAAGGVAGAAPDVEGTTAINGGFFGDPALSAAGSPGAFSSFGAASTAPLANDGFSLANAPGVNATGPDILNMGGGGMSFLDSLIPDFTKGGLDILGAIIGTHGNTEAAKIAAQSAQNALDFEKSQYAAKQAALAPYGTVGAGAIGALGSAYGLTSPAPASSVTGPAKPVLMRAPNGMTKVVSSDQAAHYQSLGATLLGDA